MSVYTKFRDHTKVRCGNSQQEGYCCGCCAEIGGSGEKPRWGAKPRVFPSSHELWVCVGICLVKRFVLSSHPALSLRCFSAFCVLFVGFGLETPQKTWRVQHARSPVLCGKGRGRLPLLRTTAASVSCVVPREIEGEGTEARKRIRCQDRSPIALCSLHHIGGYILGLRVCGIALLKPP